MSALRTLLDCMFGPYLIKIYENGTEQLYQANALERWGERFFTLWKIGVYTSPLLVGILYQKDYLLNGDLTAVGRLATGLGVVLVISYCCKGLGRYSNSMYVEFQKALPEYETRLSSNQALATYDFDFSRWPVQFDARAYTNYKSRVQASKRKAPQHILYRIAQLPFQIIAYFAIHTFGIRLLFPGSIGLLQMVLAKSLLQGRSHWILNYQGKRFKLQTSDGNTIDSMFIDRRNATPNGNTLVICADGNAGFYEIGVMITPTQAGYSTLGWNHPGFGCSTGKPFPAQEQNAVDAVMQFAINRLGFRVEDIMVFGWSIGGYATTWAAMNYPDVKGVIVDATFDHVLPLALNHMPSWWESIVKLAVTDHVNLNVCEQLMKYPGPITIIRRTNDEVICLKENDLLSNRGNNLLLKLLRYRYPLIIGSTQIELLKRYLSVTSSPQDELLVSRGVNETYCNSLLQSYAAEYSNSYPMAIGEAYKEGDKDAMALFLARKYLKDFPATHCVNLPAEMFQPPWCIGC